MTGSDVARAALLFGGGAAGLYVIGKAAVESKALERAGHGKVDALTDTREIEDVVAFTVAMTLFGATAAAFPALVETIRGRSLPAAPVKVSPE